MNQEYRKYHLHRTWAKLMLQLVSIVLFLFFLFVAVPRLKESRLLYHTGKHQNAQNINIAADNIKLKVDIVLLQKKITG